MKPKIIRNTEGRAIMGGRQTIKLNAADTAKKMSVTYSVVPANSGIPVHIHSREHETFQIVDGELEVTLNGEAQLLKKGDMVFMPKHIPHGFKALKDTSMWVTLVPGGAENMFVELAGLPPGPPDMEKVAAIAESYGIKFV
ncbi:MAG: cupin domain-containing protein [Bacteroidota bacterium]|nr:cupin domain-containing protein [Bacteroidota bacterium]